MVRFINITVQLLTDACGAQILAACEMLICSSRFHGDQVVLDANEYS